MCRSNIRDAINKKEQKDTSTSIDVRSNIRDTSNQKDTSTSIDASNIRVAKFAGTGTPTTARPSAPARTQATTTRTSKSRDASSSVKEESSNDVVLSRTDKKMAAILVCLIVPLKLNHCRFKMATVRR
jgi:hypothetical protein